MVKIRLQPKGTKKSKSYIIVVSDSRSSRNGSYIEKIGHYLPNHSCFDKIAIDFKKFSYWISIGAQPTNRISKIVTSFGFGK
jgi:small subunit ribosomal protein S16